MSDELGTDVGFLRCIFLLEHSGVFFETFADQKLLIFRQERAWARPPEELFESIQYVLLEFLAPEIPDRVPVLELLSRRA